MLQELKISSNNVIFLMIPLFVLVVCCVFSHDVVRRLMEAQDEEVSEEGIQYVAMRNLFVREAREAVGIKVEKKTRTTRMRESAERVELSKTVAIPPFSAKSGLISGFDF